MAAKGEWVQFMSIKLSENIFNANKICLLVTAKCLEKACQICFSSFLISEHLITTEVLSFPVRLSLHY